MSTRSATVAAKLVAPADLHEAVGELASSFSAISLEEHKRRAHEAIETHSRARGPPRKTQRRERKVTKRNAHWWAYCWDREEGHTHQVKKGYSDYGRSRRRSRERRRHRSRSSSDSSR